MTNPTIAKYREELKLPGGATIVLDADLAALLDIAEAAGPLVTAARRLAGDRCAADCIRTYLPIRSCTCGYEAQNEALVPVENALARLGATT